MENKFTDEDMNVFLHKCWVSGVDMNISLQESVLSVARILGVKAKSKGWDQNQLKRWWQQGYSQLLMWACLNVDDDLKALQSLSIRTYEHGLKS